MDDLWTMKHLEKLIIQAKDRLPLSTMHAHINKCGQRVLDDAKRYCKSTVGSDQFIIDFTSDSDDDGCGSSDDDDDDDSGAPPPQTQDESMDESLCSELDIIMNLPTFEQLEMQEIEMAMADH